jgi:hypothetical protein
VNRAALLASEEYEMKTVAVALAFAAAAVQEPQDRPKVPEDSVELTVIGCLEGRVLSTIERREVDVQRGPNVGARVFRVNGKREVMNEVKKRNHQLVEVVGLVKRSALDDQGVKAGRIAISGGPPVAGSNRLPTGAENVPVMDVSSVTLRATSCKP